MMSKSKVVFSSLSKVIWILIISISFSCKTGSSIQQFMVEHQEVEGFVTLDIPYSDLQSIDLGIGMKNSAIVNSLNRINLLGFRTSEENTNKYEIYTSQIKTLLKSEDYSTLIKTSFGQSGSVIFLSSGPKTHTGEFLIFAKNPKEGFVIARILGHKMEVNHLVNFAMGFISNETKLMEQFNY